ncbi:MAG TPA: UDP-N-acetylmuramoyl-L-alanine--D-glutamate ligase [Oleiagrimonas sp.]|nr:UDP-N-acetylmuramoyl-L-alanine--D-glutamate ligase [Oleiagrimonas sp.]
MKFATLEDRRVAVWGYGREGRAALGALLRHLPGQPLTLFCRAAEVADDTLPAGVQVCTDAPDADALAAFDYVIKSPGISIYKPEVIAAQARGTVFTSGTALWFGENPDARVIGITGTKGKSTTAAITAHVARALGVRTALAGNIGLPLLELEGQQADLWIVELSSFQTGEAGPLTVGVVLNLYEEHLDWHGSRERYFSDKLKLAAAAHTLVVDAGHDELLARTASHPARHLFDAPDGWHLHGNDLCRVHDVIVPALTTHLHVPGTHNARNACATLTALEAANAFDEQHARTAAQALDNFNPLPHRLQYLGERNGVRWINDSISTTPAASRAALESFRGQPVTLILGGHDRGLDWTDFARFAAGWPDLHLITQGANGARIATALREHAANIPLAETDNLESAIKQARQLTRRNGLVILSPGAPSFDQFKAYTERGCRFADLAGFDGTALGTISGLGIH